MWQEMCKSVQALVILADPTWSTDLDSQMQSRHASVRGNGGAVQHPSGRTPHGRHTPPQQLLMTLPCPAQKQESKDTLSGTPYPWSSHLECGSKDRLALCAWNDML